MKELSSAKASVTSTETHILDGCRMRVEKAKVNSTLYLTSIPKTLSDTVRALTFLFSLCSQELRAECEVYGKVESVSIMKDKTTQEPRGSAFVKFVYREDTLDAMLGLKQQYPHWKVEWAKSTKNIEPPSVDRKAIFIGGLVPFRITEQLVKEKFGRYGEIDSLSLINPIARNGESAEEGESTSN